MTIEIHKPELAALIKDRMDRGEFQGVEDALFEALKSEGTPTGANLIAAMQASPYKEIDIEPSRDRHPVRDANL